MKNKRLIRRLTFLLLLSLLSTGLAPYTYFAENETENLEVTDDVLPEDMISDNEISGNDTSEDETSEEETSEESISESNVSEDSIIEEVLSENAISVNSVSDNDVIEEAREAFRRLTKEQDVLALIYLSNQVEVKEEPDYNSNTIASLPSGTSVLITDFAVSQNQLWYRTKILGTENEEGFVPKENLAYSDERLLAWEEEWKTQFFGSGVLRSMERIADARIYEDISLFPASYQEALTKLKNNHSKWQFVAYEPGLDWESSVAAQKGERSYIWYTAPEEYKDGRTGQPNWYYASTKAINYYMDPRNSLTEDSVFQNELLTYNSSYHTQATVQALLNGCFMSGNIPGTSKSYANAFYEIGTQLKMSPIHLAARVRQEQGVRWLSSMISGKYPGYEGYYNYFNIKASGSTPDAVIRNGLKYAKEQGWNTRYKSILGGAMYLNSGYIKEGQDTQYLQKFDMVGTPYTHQYMQNIQAPSTEASKTRSGYSDAGVLNQSFVFKIPIYEKMPNEVVPLKLNKSSLTLDHPGEEYTFKVYENGKQVSNTAMSWSSSNPSVATITTSGIVKGISVGKTTITIRNSKGDQATCRVTVKNVLERVYFTVSSASLERGQTVSLDLVYEPFDTTDDKTVVWKTTDKKVASISDKKNGDGIYDIATITAGIPGDATITATVGSLKAECKIKTTAYLKSISMNQSQMSLFTGETDKLMVTYEPVYTSDDTEITWRSSDDTVATVDAGTVTTHNPGNAVITASMNSANGKTFTTSCQITVSNCQVVYYDEQGVEQRREEERYGDILGNLPELTVSGNYEFAGWYSMKDGKGVKYSAESQITKDLFLYPYFMETDKGFFVKPIGDQMYTGKAIKPKVQVYDKEKLLIQNVDYTVTYKNNKLICDTSVIEKAPTVIVKGIGNYKGKQGVYFNIVKANLHSSDIKVTDLVYAYNGSLRYAKPLVMQGTRKLVNKRDYEISYPQASEEGAYVQPGVYPILLRGIGNYEGKLLINEVISKKVLASKLTVAKIANQTYTGNETKPILLVKYKKNLLREGTHYRVRYENNVSIGTATAIITGIESAGYIGSKTVTYKVTGADIRKVMIQGVEDKTFDERMSQTGIEQSGVTLYGQAGEGRLVENVDYQVSYINNKKAGTATIVFTGMGRYSKVLKKKFKINKAELAETPSAAFTVPYEKGGARPEPVVSLNGIVLEKGKDYTVSYVNNKSVNDNTEGMSSQIQIRGRGNYKGLITREFYITQKNFLAVQVTALDGIYKPKPGKFFSAPVLTDTNGKKLTKGKDYENTVEYRYLEEVKMCDEQGTIKHAGDLADPTDIPPAGTRIRISIQGCGNYSADRITCDYRIATSSIAKAVVLASAKEYTGSAVTLLPSEINVRVDRIRLGDGDFVILPETYKKNIKKGTASVCIQGLGNYGGQKVITFKILPKTIVWWWNLITQV